MAPCFDSAIEGFPHRYRALLARNLLLHELPESGLGCVRRLPWSEPARCGRRGRCDGRVGVGGDSSRLEKRASFLFPIGGARDPLADPANRAWRRDVFALDELVLIGDILYRL